MSIEYPEIKILEDQLKKSVLNKRVNKVMSQATDKLKQIGFMNKQDADVLKIEGKTIKQVEGRGNSLVLNFSDAQNILFSPEYGGWLSFHQNIETKHQKYHLKVIFTDNSSLIFRLRSMGVIYVSDNEHIIELYTYKRDFGLNPSFGTKELDISLFKNALKSRNVQLKPLLVGKDAIGTGMSNASFQEVLYLAKVHPRRKTGSLSDIEIERLYNTINELFSKRMQLGGKSDFIDLNGSQGKFHFSMGPHMKEKNCLICSAMIQQLAHGGGTIYLCPSCQVEA